MRKLLAIAWKEIYENLSDRNLLLIMIAAPLAIASIVGLAFGGLGRESGSPIEHIPVAVINNDQPTIEGFTYGELLADLMVSGDPQQGLPSDLSDCPIEPGGQTATAEVAMSLDRLIDGELLDSRRVQELLDSGEIDPPAVAEGSQEFVRMVGRAAVDRAVYSALVYIPAGFSDALASLSDASGGKSPATVEVYANSGRRLAPGIVLSVVDGIVGQMASGNIVVGTTVAEIIMADGTSATSMDAQSFGTLISCAFAVDSDQIGIDVQPIQAAAESNSAGAILVAVGSAQAMFFALFTGQFGILSLHEERKNWTLQRLVASPTPRWAILGGKLLGVMGTVVFQLLSLVLALTLVGSLISGEPTMIWGTDWLSLAGLLLAVSSAVGGISMLLAGVLRSVEQANILASLINMALAILGGAFGFSMPMPIAGVSMIHWGREAFQLLASGQGDIGLHLAILAGQGILLFAIGLILFNRRFEVGG